MTRTLLSTVVAGAVSVLVTVGCSGAGPSADVSADGSSTVGPFMVKAADDFLIENPNVEVDVDISRSGRGFDRFCSGEIDIANASRPIDEDEAAQCAEEGIKYVELHVANDALTVAIHTPILYDWVTCLTVAQLRKIWEPGSDVDNWQDVDPSFPDVPLELYGADTDSGTFDYFTFVINGDRGASRTDYAATEDDNDTVEGVADDTGALGYFGFSYYAENRERLTALEIDGGNGCVGPSVATVQDGSYRPLSRPLYIYVNQDALTGSKAVRDFVRHVLENEQRIAQKARFVPLNTAQIHEQLEKLSEAEALR